MEDDWSLQKDNHQGAVVLTYRYGCACRCAIYVNILRLLR